jgi:hypothetical protein
MRSSRDGDKEKLIPLYAGTLSVFAGVAVLHRSSAADFFV